MTKPRLYILDANALLHRAWHALPPLTAPDGMVVNAVYGVLMVMLKLLTDKKPDAFVACWDTEAPTFRHEAYAEYKAGREEQPDELYAQLPLLQEGLGLLGVPSVELDGFEADDLLGTIATRAVAKGWDVTIVTGDRDALQLVQPGISVLAFKKGVSETITFDEAEVQAQYGLTPSQFLEYKAMRGDPSDNIPGIRGIGEKGATDLLQKYGDLKGVYQAAHDPKSALTKSIREKLLNAEQEIPALMKLVRIVTDVPIEYEPRVGSAVTADPEALRAFLLKLGFRTLLSRVETVAKMTAAASASAESGDNARPNAAKKQVAAQTPASLSTFSATRVEAAKDARDVLNEQLPTLLRATGDAQAPLLLIHVARGLEGSLFGAAVDGVILGVGTSLWFLTADVCRAKDVSVELQKLFKDPTVSRLAHDGKEQMKWLETIGFQIGPWKMDTMLAAYLLGAGERNHDLAAVASRYVNLVLPEDAPTLLQAEAIMRAVEPLRAEIAEQHLERVLERFELPLIPVLRDMEREGILIDPAYLSSLSTEMLTRKQELDQQMVSLVGRPFNPASPAQLAEILFDQLKLPTKGVKKGKTGYSTAANELEKLHGKHPIIELIEEFREVAKLLSTYVEVMPKLADKEGRVHTTFNQAVTATGRLSSTDPNLQNIPIRSELGRKIRRAFIAKPGYRLLSCDYSQIELRIMAALAKDDGMRAAFERGEDIHTATAAAILGIPKDEVTKDQRRIAKAINFGLIFGQGPQGLSQAAGISFVEAKEFIAKYFEAYAGIKRYMVETKALALQLGYVETLFGRRRLLPEIASMLPQVRAQAERMAVNMPVQGTDADLMKLAMITLHAELPTRFPDARMLLQVHDELVFEVPEAQVADVAAYVKDVMESVEKIGVPIVVEAKAGENWEEMKKL